MIAKEESPALFAHEEIFHDLLEETMSFRSSDDRRMKSFVNRKCRAVGEGPRAHQLVGRVMAYQGDDG